MIESTDTPALEKGNGPYAQPAEGAGIKAQVSDYMQDAMHLIQDFAQYVRSNDVNTMRDDLVTHVRERPLTSLAVGVGIGFVLGKLLRR